MKKRNLFVSLMFVLSLSLAGCGGGTTGGENAGGEAQPKNNDPSQVIVATGGTGGTYYPLGGGMAEQITKHAGVTATAQSTGASAENMRLIRDKKADIAFTQSDIAQYASEGSNMFQQDGKIDSFQALGALYNETVQIVVSADSNIKGAADLKGKRVSVGAPGSGTEANAQQILEAYGLTFGDLQVQRLSFSDSSKAIQDGQLDAAFQTAGTPTAAITELAATKGVKIIPLDADKIDALIQKYPFYVKTTIPGNTYQTVAEDADTISVKSVLVVRSDLSEDLVYKITKAIFENTDKLGHAKAKEIDVNRTLTGVSLPIHPGAKKYFDEKGVK